jgi:hypothetical protein
LLVPGWATRAGAEAQREAQREAQCAMARWVAHGAVA